MPRAALEHALTFDNSAPFQSDWLGVGATYMPFAPFKLTAAQAQVEYDRAYTSGIKIARAWVMPQWAYATWPTGSANYLSSDMLKFYSWVQSMKDRGIQVIVTLGWHFPGDVCGISDPFGPACTPTVPNETQYAAWVSEILHQLINVRGFTNIYGVMFFTEPNTSGTGTLPGGYTQTTYYTYLVTTARAKIVTDDASRTPILPRIKLIGTEEHSYTTPDFTVATNAAGAPTDINAAHSYIESPDFPPLGIAPANNPNNAAWIARWQAWNAAVSPKRLIADEINTLVGGNDDTTGYRATADAGLQFARWVKGHMDGGCASSLAWQLQDQDFVGSSPLFQKFGVAGWIGTDSSVKPAWYAFSMLANLTGGGGGTKLYRAINGNAALHATGVFIPYGQRHTVDPSGEWSFVVINEGPGCVRTQVRFSVPLASPRRFYRYVFSAEFPPATAANPAYLTPWDMVFPEVGNVIPANVIPGRSVVVYSTINLSAPANLNLALTATAASDSTGLGSPDNVNDGNFTNVQGAGNGWRKADDGSHYWEAEWGGPVTIGRVALAFVGTTPGVVYATYLDASTPAPVADYTVKWWNGTTYVDFPTPVNVTGNTSPNRSHSFAQVSTTKVRVTVTSVAATGQINQFAAYAA